MCDASLRATMRFASSFFLLLIRNIKTVVISILVEIATQSLDQYSRLIHATAVQKTEKNKGKSCVKLFSFIYNDIRYSREAP